VRSFGWPGAELVDKPCESEEAVRTTGLHCRRKSATLTRACRPRAADAVAVGAC